MAVYYLRVPMDRVAVLIGSNGESKAAIEGIGKVKITVDSNSGDIEIYTGEDPVLGMKSRDVVQAIGRGFSPQNAMKIFNDDVYFITIDIKDFVKNKKNHLKRVRSRVIGTNGKTKKFIEKETETLLSIYGSTVSVIGKLDMVEIVKDALTLLLRGSEHNIVYGVITRRVREARLNE